MLNINMEYNRGILFVRLKGSLNKLTSYKLINSIVSTIKNCGIKNLVYNFERLESIDNDGYKTLLLSYDEIIKNKGTILVINNRFNLMHFKEVDNELSALKILQV